MKTSEALIADLTNEVRIAINDRGLEFGGRTEDIDTVLRLIRPALQAALNTGLINATEMIGTYEVDHSFR